MEYASELTGFERPAPPAGAAPARARQNILATSYVPPSASQDSLVYSAVLGKSREGFVFETSQGTLSLTPVHPSSIVPGNVPFAGMRFTFAGELFTLWLPAGALSALLYRTDADVSLSQIAPVTRGLVFESLFEDLFEELEATGIALHVDEISDPVRNPPGTIGLKITLADLPPFVAMVEAPKQVADRFLNWAAQLPEERRSISDLPVMARVMAGLTWLPSADLANLRPGDAIVFDVSWLQQKRAPVVIGEQIVRACAVEQRGFVVLDEPAFRDIKERNMWLMEGDMTAERGPGMEPEVGLVDDLEVKMTFELGRLQMTVGDVEKIDPGYVFELLRQPNQAVDIYVLNRLVGWGELVMVTDKIGVRVTKIFK